MRGFMNPISLLFVTYFDSICMPIKSPLVSSSYTIIIRLEPEEANDDQQRYHHDPVVAQEEPTFNGTSCFCCCCSWWYAQLIQFVTVASAAVAGEEVDDLL